jgi:hypothetical protein
LEIEFSLDIPILPILWVQAHIRSVRGSNPCTATKGFNSLASKSRGANVVQNPLHHFFNPTIINVSLTKNEG